MTGSDLGNASIGELVENFATVCVQQGKALEEDEVAKFNRLYERMAAIRDELKARPGDQRRALLALFDHGDVQVQLQAARAALAVAPEKSRALIEKIAASQWFPQAGDAGMCLWAIDEGIFKPE